MIYLTGATNDADEPTLISAGIGLIVQPGTKGYNKRIERYPWWAADNGCYADKWSEDPWLDWLVERPRERCLFAVAPDVYPDAAGSLERGSRYFALIRDLGFPVALVAQDGAEQLDLPWDDFDALFIGGEKRDDPETEWKISEDAARLVRRARNHGKWVHMGRVNTLKRLRRARLMGCNSADGTFLRHRRRARAYDADGDIALRGAPELRAWGAWLRANPVLPTFSTFESPSLAVHREAVAP